ncbi:MAG: efflux transporter periplasmic adaptor subunit, partial [Pseudomonadota bacterium]
VQLVRRQGEDVLVRARGLTGQQIVAERSPLLGAGIKVRPLAPVAGTDMAAAAPAMIALDDDRRSRLIAFVEANQRMPAAARERVLTQLQKPQVPAAMVERIEGRMGG